MTEYEKLKYEKLNLLTKAFPNRSKNNALSRRSEWSGLEKRLWEREPDEERWIDDATGIPCRASRNMSAVWCGCIALDKAHPLWGIDSLYRIAEFVDYECGHNSFWLVGFDCGHLCHHRPADTHQYDDDVHRRYVTLAEVKRMIKGLALAFSKVRRDIGNKDVIVYENPDRDPEADPQWLTWVPPVPHHIGNIKQYSGRGGATTFTIYDEAGQGIVTHFSVPIDEARKYLNEYYPRLGGEALDRALVQYWAKTDTARDHADAILLAAGRLPKANKTQKEAENDSK